MARHGKVFMKGKSGYTEYKSKLYFENIDKNQFNRFIICKSCGKKTKLKEHQKISRLYCQDCEKQYGIVKRQKCYNMDCEEYDAYYKCKFIKCIKEDQWQPSRT